ncbi:MAG: hypothetical protein R2741_14425 [Methanolobus sp.]
MLVSIDISVSLRISSLVESDAVPSTITDITACVPSGIRYEGMDESIH